MISWAVVDRKKPCTPTVLFLIDSLRSGGKERQMSELVSTLVRRNDVDCHVVVMNTEVHYGGLISAGVPVHFVVRRFRWDWRPSLVIGRLCRTIRPDVIHVWDYMTGVYVLPVALATGTPLVNGAIRNASPRTRHSVSGTLRNVVQRAASINVSNSQAGLDAAGIKRARGMVIRNGLDLSRVVVSADTVDRKRKLGIRTDYVVGMVATATEKKDYSTFLAAASNVLALRDDVTFVAVGKADAVHRRLFDDFAGTTDRFRYLGERRDVEEIISCFDVGVLMTNTAVHEEGISNAILEYMAHGKPVIATYGPGNREVVSGQETGYLIPAGDSGTLAARILHLLSNPDLAASMGRAGRRKVEASFDHSAMVESYLNLYSGLCADRDAS